MPKLDKDGRWADKWPSSLADFNRRSSAHTSTYAPMLKKLPPWELTGLADAVSEELRVRNEQLRKMPSIPAGINNRMIYGDHEKTKARV